MNRADFYIGPEGRAEWIGSLRLDGYQRGLTTPGFPKGVVGNNIYEHRLATHPLLAAKTETDYRRLVEHLLSSRGDAVRPQEGRQWPAEDTEHVYRFNRRRVWYRLGRRWRRADTQAA